MTQRKHHIAAAGLDGLGLALCGTLARGHHGMHKDLAHLSPPQRDVMYLRCLKKLNSHDSWALYHQLTRPKSHPLLSDTPYAELPRESMRCMTCHVPEPQGRGAPCLPGGKHAYVTRRPGQSSSEAEAALTSTPEEPSHA
jgi:hypothetical protein